LLDLRLGSSNVANTNDPLYLAPDQHGYIYTPGTSGNYFSVPHAANLSTTDLDVRVRVAMDDWTPSSVVAFASKWTSGTNTRSWVFGSYSGGTFFFQWSADGNTQAGVRQSTAAPSETDGAPLWVRVTFDADNGSGSYDLRFYTAPDSPTEPTSWTQLGNTVTGTASSLYGSNTAMLFAAATSGVGNQMSAKFYRAVMEDGIDGTTVLDVDCDALTSGSATSFTATTGQTVTINRSTSGRKSVAMPSRWKGGRACFLLGTDDYLEVQGGWQHQLLNFNYSPGFSVVNVHRQWATPGNFSALLNKGEYYSITRGWGTYNNSTGANIQGSVARKDLSSTLFSRNSAYTLGSTAVTGIVVTPGGREIRSFGNGTLSSQNTGTDASDSYTTFAMRFGRAAAGGSNLYVDAEFTAAAVFRRALTAAEIKTISDYYTGA
jgi:hypothetical protein